MNKPLTKPKSDLTGRTQGRLTVLGFESYRPVGKQGQRAAWWNCRCSCGTEKAISQGQIVSGQKSCGCLLDEFRRDVLPVISSERNSGEPGQAAFNIVFGGYRWRAAKIGVPFDLSSDEFLAITQMPCKYCGVERFLTYTARGGNGSFQYNGIDRIDNTLGYTTENSAPCCEICNKAKRDLPEKDFIEWIYRITNFQIKRTK